MIFQVSQHIYLKVICLISILIVQISTILQQIFSFKHICLAEFLSYYCLTCEKVGDKDNKPIQLKN